MIPRPSASLALVALLLLSAVLWLSPVPGNAAILDQQNAPAGNVFESLTVANDRSQIQSFLVGITGTLTRIDVQIGKRENTVENLVLTVWTADSQGLPTNKLASASLPASAVPPLLFLQSMSFTTFDLSAAAIPVFVDESLAILLDSATPNNPPFTERYEWLIGGQYPRGVAYTKLGSVFSPQGDDFHFKTFVSVPEPPAWVLLALGVCAFYLRRVTRRRLRMLASAPRATMKSSRRPVARDSVVS
jgi:hypothetical protein